MVFQLDVGRKCCVAAAAVLLSATPALAKTPTRYFFYARVTRATGPNCPVPGTIVPITVVVDRSFPAYSRKNHVTTYYGGSGYDLPSPILQAKIDGKKEHGIFDTITVTQDLNGIWEIEINSASPQGGPGFDLQFQTTLNGVVKTNKIPPHIYPGNFMTASFSATLDPLDQYSGTITQ